MGCGFDLDILRSCANIDLPFIIKRDDGKIVNKSHVRTAYRDCTATQRMAEKITARRRGAGGRSIQIDKTTDDDDAAQCSLRDSIENVPLFHILFPFQFASKQKPETSVCFE